MSVELEETTPLQANMEQNKTQTRRYEVWPGHNRFFFGGKYQMGPDNHTMSGAIVLIMIPSIVYFVFVCPMIWATLSPAIPIIGGILCVSTICLLFLTACVEPGIVMRDVEGMYEYEMNRHKSLFTPPRTRKVEVNGVEMMQKYCDTCKLYRPLRASHCSECNNCVERFDHHCPWIGGDVGKRNYRFFVLFVTLCFVDCLLYGGSSLANLIVASIVSNFWEAILVSPASLVVAIYCLFMMCSVGTLTCFHCYLVCENVTTHEDIRGQFRGKDRKNPFSSSKGRLGNFVLQFCGPMDPENVDFMEMVDEREKHLLLAYGGDHRMTQEERNAFRKNLREERKQRAEEAEAEVNTATPTASGVDFDGVVPEADPAMDNNNNEVPDDSQVIGSIQNV